MKTTVPTVATTLMMAVLALPLGAVPRTEFTLMNGEDPRSLDPQKTATRGDARVAGALFEGLVAYDADGQAKPGLAEKWTLNGKTATFFLRKTSWSDGKPITARTVADSWKRGLAAGLPLLVRWVSSVRAADERTLEVAFTEPLPTLTLLADPAFAVLPMHVVDDWGTLWAQPEHLTVNGPFTLDSWTPRSRLTVVPNPAYWDKAHVKLTKITFLSGNFDVGETLFKGGAADWLPDAPPARLDTRRRADYVSLALGSYFLRLNLADPVLADVRVRRALSLGFDRDVLVREVLHGGQAAALSLVPAMGGYDPPEGPQRDAAAARRLLAEAGYPGGKGFPLLTLLANTGETHRKVLEFLADEWKRNLGIGADVKSENWTAYLDDLAGRNYQAARSAWLADYFDPLTFLGLFTSASPDNHTGYANPAYDALIAQGAAASGVARWKAFRQAETLLETDLPFIPLFHYTAGNRIDLTRWSGWATNALDVHPLKDIAPKIR
jgi:oligopeptide transport system substrate-binding protein